MINKLLFTGLFLMSTMTYAETITTNTVNNPLSSLFGYKEKLDDKYYYDYDVKNKSGTIQVYATTRLGLAVPFSTVSIPDALCRLQIEHSLGATEIAPGALPVSGTQVKILPVKDKDGVLETLIELSDTKYVKKENAQAVNEDCSISNTLSTTTSLRWLGDLPFDKEKTIKLSNGDELYITLFRNAPKK
jgi:hypothetical protein